MPRTRDVVFALISACAALVGACKSNEINQTNNATGSIGPQGGVVQGPQGSELRVPGGALTQNTAFSISIAQPGTYPAIATSYDVGGNSIFAFEPHGQQFLSPATVAIPYLQKPVSGVILRAEPGDSAWSELVTSGTGANTLEATVSALSFFVVADKSTADGGAGGPSCAGRGASAGNTNGTVSATGVYAGPGGTTFDLTKVVSGFASPAYPNSSAYNIVFADYANACGYSKNADYKIGGSFIDFVVCGMPGGCTPAPPTVRTYGTTEVGPSVVTVPSSAQVGTQVGQAPSQCNLDNQGTSASSGTGLTISAADATHVTGSFDIVLGPNFGNAELKGTFDVPVCSPDPSLKMAGGLSGYSNCCMQ